MKYSIRQLTISDYDNLISLWRKCGLPYRPNGRDSRETIAIEIARPESGFIGMFDNSKLIGFVLATSDGRKGWINRLAIDPDYQRQGLGQTMITEAENFLAGLKLKVIAALIEEGNEPSFATFKKAGYIFHEDIFYYSKRTSADD